MAAEEKKEESESSGLSDILELAASLGTDDDEDSGPNPITRSVDSDDDSGPIAPGYGGVASEALVGDVDPLPPPPPMAKTPKTAADPSPAKPKPQPVRSTPAAASVVAAPVEPTERKGGMMLWVVVGAIAAAGIAFFVINANGDRKPEVVDVGPPVAKVVETPAAAQPTPPPTEPAPVPAVVAEADDEVEEAEPDETIEVAEEDAADPEADAAVVASARAGRKRSPKAATEEPKAEPSSAPKKEIPEPEPDAPDEPETPAAPPTNRLDDPKFSSECLLNPNKPGCAELRKRQELEKKNLDTTLPDKLSLSQIRDAVSPHKNKAKACGTKYGIEAGTTVRVKLSISGETGKVISAAATAPHDAEPVGQCVADIFKDATFPRFKSPQQGTVYPFRL